jgi:hypothetical protein
MVCGPCTPSKKKKIDKSGRNHRALPAARWLIKGNDGSIANSPLKLLTRRRKVDSSLRKCKSSVRGGVEGGGM